MASYRDRLVLRRLCLRTDGRRGRSGQRARGTTILFPRDDPYHYTVIPFRYWASFFCSSPSPSLSGTGLMEMPILLPERGSGILQLLLRKSSCSLRRSMGRLLDKEHVYARHRSRSSTASLSVLPPYTIPREQCAPALCGQAIEPGGIASDHLVDLRLRNPGKVPGHLLPRVRERALGMWVV